MTPRRSGCTSRLGLPGKQYVAFLGMLEPRKNVPNLIRGWAEAVRWRDDPPALVLAGGSGWDDDVDAAVAEVPSHLRVLRPGYLRFQDLPGYLGGALVVAYPSHGEGFGLPVLEAMACGAPVLTTPRLSLPEVGGDAVAYTEPDAESIAVSLSALLDDAERRAGARRAGRGAGRRVHLGGERRGAPRQLRPRRCGVTAAQQLPRSPGGLTVVVVTYSPGDQLDTFLDTLADATSQPYDVVLADNGSTDGAPEGAARRPGVSIVRSPGNIGYGAAANLGAAARTGEWLVVANPDISWRRGALDALLDATERWPTAGAFGPAIVTPDGALYPSARALPSLVAWHRPRPRRLVVAVQPVDRGLPQRARGPA